MLLIQLIAVVGFIFLLLSSIQKEKDKILLYSIGCYIAYSIHYLLLNAKSGYIISVINLLRSLFLSIKDRHKLLQKNILLFIFILIYILVSYITYQDIYSLLPILGAVIYTSCLWQGNVKEIKLGSIINGILWVIYNIHVLSYVCMVTDSIIALINLIVLIRMCKDERFNQRKTKSLT